METGKIELIEVKGIKALIREGTSDRFIVDDSQVCRLQAEKVYGKTPRTEIIIEEI